MRVPASATCSLGRRRTAAVPQTAPSPGQRSPAGDRSIPAAAGAEAPSQRCRPAVSALLPALRRRGAPGRGRIGVRLFPGAAPPPRPSFSRGSPLRRSAAPCLPRCRPSTPLRAVRGARRLRAPQGREVRGGAALRCRAAGREEGSRRRRLRSAPVRRRRLPRSSSGTRMERVRQAATGREGRSRASRRECGVCGGRARGVQARSVFRMGL